MRLLFWVMVLLLVFGLLVFVPMVLIPTLLERLRGFPVLMIGMLVAFSIHVAMTYLPVGNLLLSTQPVTVSLWLQLLMLSLPILIVMEQPTSLLEIPGYGLVGLLDPAPLVVGRFVGELAIRSHSNRNPPLPLPLSTCWAR